MADKLLVTNRSAMQSKYGSVGVASVTAALARLVASDARRGLKTIVVEIDDPATMSRYGGKPLMSVKDDRGAKLAVEAVAIRENPDYVVLIDGPDVIPHVRLMNPMPSDGDPDVPSDLPYASGGGGFGRETSNYLKITRVVGRIPNAAAATNPSDMIAIVDHAAAAILRPASEYQDYWGLTATVWGVSTGMSLDAVFGNHSSLDHSPPVGPPAPAPGLTRMSHFINCHGATLDDTFYGQDGDDYPPAMTSAQVAAAAPSGAVVTAECCYGAQLYDRTLAAKADPMAMAYLKRGALCYLGSTNIAYGPAAANGQADLLTQFFFADMLSGASSGRALLQARQRFVLTQRMTDPSNLKTLAQFLLLGDPSLAACLPVEKLAEAAFDGVDVELERKSRRVGLSAVGAALPSAKAVATPDGPRLAPPVLARVREQAARRGMKVDTETMLGVHYPGRMRAAMKGPMDRPEAVMVLTEKQARGADIGYRHLIAHIIGEAIAAIEEIESR